MSAALPRAKHWDYYCESSLVPALKEHTVGEVVKLEAMRAPSRGQSLHLGSERAPPKDQAVDGGV